MTKELTVATLPVNIKERLTDACKKQLVAILSSSFHQKRTQYKYEIDAQKNDLLNDYKKKNKFEELIKKMRQYETEIENIKEKCWELGLDVDGDISNRTCNGRRNQHAYELERKMETLSDSINPINELQAKLEARLWMATTVGEATVIMREVLGNKQIPTLSTEHLKEV